jgi:hypothetical protein
MVEWTWKIDTNIGFFYQMHFISYEIFQLKMANAVIIIH